MTQIALPVAFVTFVDEKVKCDYRPEDEKWGANLSGSGAALAAQLEKKQAKPEAGSENELSASRWPSQAHHLIPHKTLNDHDASGWLNESKSGSKLYADTRYNVDHRNNGKWMPYASSLPEWVTGATKKADKDSNRKLLFKIMELARIQIHQGRHSTKNKYGIGKMGYKERVKQYLDKIDNNGISHYVGVNACEDCKERNGKYPPRDNSVRYVDKASEFIEADIKAGTIFVSRIAAEFVDAGGIADR